MSKRKKAILRIVLTVLGLVAAEAAVKMIPMEWYWQLLCFLPVYLLIGYDVVLASVSGIGRGQIFDENFLMVLATIGAFGTGQYPEAVAVMLLYQIGEQFQKYAVEKSRGSISDLMELRPDTARVVENGEERECEPEEVTLAQIIRVKPGERIPLDGRVLHGESDLDTSALTGESLPRHCQVGEEVLSGSVVLSGVLDLEVTKEFYDSTVSQILDMVENATDKKGRAERLITRFAKYYTPIVVLLAVLMAFVPPLLVGDWSGWIQKAMNFLVISCPCALVISVPLSFFSGIGASARHGILVKGGTDLENLAKTNVFVFDKTGTITKGQFEVAQVLPAEKREEILQAAALAEAGSLHPIAKSIVRAAGSISNEGWTIGEQAGFGIEAQKDQECVLAGNDRLMASHGITCQNPDAIGTVVHVAKNGEYLGCIVVADVLKEDAKDTMHQMKQMQISTKMLTGDRQDVAAKIAADIGMADYAAELLPGDKVHHVEQMLEQKGKQDVVAFVGDGINDAPVLVRADVGIAMGGIGSDAAIEAADVVLMNDRLLSLITAKRIAKKTMRIVWQNIIFALGIKLLVLCLTPFGLVSIWLAIFADVGVAVLAILNAMRASYL